MKRFIAFAAFAALIASCSADATVAPRTLHGTGPSFDPGDPPPPPVVGDGDGFFSAGGESIAAILQSCVVSTDTHYEFAYTTNATDPEMHEVAHIRFDEGILPGEADDLSHHITIHENLQGLVGVKAHGTIVGQDFSFNITGSNGGTLSPSFFSVSVKGILKTPDGSCGEVDANFSGSLASD